MEDLGVEMVVYVFSFLPLKDLVTCLLVNKSFHTAATEDTLWKVFAVNAGCVRKKSSESDSARGVVVVTTWRETLRESYDAVAWKKKWTAKENINVVMGAWCCIKPEMECCAWGGDNIYLGARGPTLYNPKQEGGLYFASPPFNSGFPPQPACKEWEYGPVNWIDDSASLLACACSGKTGNDGYVVIYSTESKKGTIKIK